MTRIIANHGNPDCSFCGRTKNEVQNIFKGPGVNVCNDCLVAGRLKNYNPNQSGLERFCLPRKLTGYESEIIEQLVIKQFNDNVHVDDYLLDLLIMDREIDLTGFKDQKRARKLWHRLILISLISPEGYNKCVQYIKECTKKL